MSEAEIRKMAQTGELEFGRVAAAILATTEAGGRFEGMAEKMSATASGTFGTLTAQAETLIAKGGFRLKSISLVSGVIPSCSLRRFFFRMSVLL